MCDWRPNIIRTHVHDGSSSSLTIQAASQELIQMAGDGNLMRVKDLVEYRGAHLNERDEHHGCTALYRAVQNRHAHVAEYLLRKGANVNISDSSLETPLFKATRNNLYDLVRLLLLTGANPNTGNAWGDRPLFIASRCGFVAVAEALLDAGADVNAVNVNEGNETPLFAAVLSRRPDIVKLLVSKGANVNAYKAGATALHVTSFLGLVELIDALLSETKNDNNAVNVDLLDRDGRTALYRASSRGHAQVVQALLQAGANPLIQVRGTTALELAAQKGHLIIVQMLQQVQVSRYDDPQNPSRRRGGGRSRRPTAELKILDVVKQPPKVRHTSKPKPNSNRSVL